MHFVIGLYLIFGNIVFPFSVIGQEKTIQHLTATINTIQNYKTENLKNQEYDQLINYINQQHSSDKSILYKHIFSIDSTDLAIKKLTLPYANILLGQAQTDEALDHFLKIIWKYIDLENNMALFFADQMTSFSTVNKLFEGHAKAIEAKGLYYEIAENNTEKALQYYLESIAICETHKLSYLADVYHTVGVLFHLSDNYIKAKQYYTSALELSKKNNNLKVQKRSLINLGSIYSSLKDYEKAENFMIQSLQIEVDSHNDFETFANLGNLYMRQHNFEKALPFLEKATSKHPDNAESEVNLRFLIDAKSKLKDTSNINSILDRAIIALDGNKSIREKSLMTRSISNYFRAVGNYEKALQYSDEYTNLYSEIIENQKNEVILELEAKYQSEKIKATLAKREKQKQFLSIGLIFLLAIIVAVLLFYKKRLKYQKTISKQREELQQQQIKELQQKNKMIAMNSMVSGQEAERKRIAKDLHDGLGGVLSAIKTYHSSLKHTIPSLVSHEGYKKTDLLIDEACGEIRKISHNMMPHALSLSGLESALADLGETLNQEGINTKIEINPIKVKINDTKTVMIYRLVQELVNNIKKHAQAKNALIQLINHSNELIITIEDNGIGFTNDSQNTMRGIGLTSVLNRVVYLEGSIDIDSEINKGTTITIKIPVK